MSFNLRDFLKVKPTQWVVGGIVFMGTVAPGCLVILQFRPELFILLSTAKVVLLAVALTLPVVLLNVLVALPRLLATGKVNPESDELVDPADLYRDACLFASVVLYTSVAVAHFLSLTFRQFSVAVLVINVLCGVWAWRSLMHESRN